MGGPFSIHNNAKRKFSYQGRKKTLQKKLGEIGTRCGVQCCCIMLNPPNQRHADLLPNEATVKRVVDQFNNKAKKTAEMKAIVEQLSRLADLAKTLDHSIQEVSSRVLKVIEE